MVKGNLPLLYAHAVSLKTANKPRVTFTSHAGSNGETVWYLGGNLAERGATLSSDALIIDARHEIAQLLPWIKLDSVQWATLEVNRIEAAQTSNARPDYPFVKSMGNSMVCWPTKLTLAPMLGQMVLENLLIEPGSGRAPLPELPAPPYARTPWEHAFD